MNSDEEIQRRIILVGDYVKETSSSTRETAKYFTENYFPISNATVSNYLKKYMKLSRNNKLKIMEIIDENKPKTIKDENIRTRVLKVYDLIKLGFTIEEISLNLNVDYWSIYYDIYKRLKMLDENKYNEIKEILKNRSEENLKPKKFK